MATKEKFEEAKRLYETANADQRYVLESLFPELKESDDERIRKELIKEINGLWESDSATWPSSLEKKNKYIAWLEKQGEQKPAWSEEDENRLSDAIFFVREYQIPTRDKRLLNAAKEAEDWLKSLRPQNKWKPSNEQMDALLYVVRNYTPGVTERIAWESIKTLELMFKDLKKLKG